MIIRRLVSATCVLALALALASCSDDDPTEPCATCPESRATLTVDRESYAVTDPIQVGIENHGDEVLFTDACQWTLLGITNSGQEAVQDLDCTLIDVYPLTIASGATETLGVELDPDALPPLDRYRSFEVEVVIFWDAGEGIDSAGFRTGRFALEVP